MARRAARAWCCDRWSAAACAHWFTTGIRLHQTWSDSPLSLRANGAIPGSLAPALRNRGFAFKGFASGITPAYLSNEQLQGKLLSAYKISQAYPGAPRFALRLLSPLSRWNRNPWYWTPHNLLCERLDGLDGLDWIAWIANSNNWGV